MRLIQAELLRDIDAMKFEQPLSHLCAHRTDQEHSTFVALYFRMVPPGSVSDKWTVVCTFSSLRRTVNKERQEQRLTQDIRSVPCEYGRSIRDDSCAPRLREFITIAIESRGKFIRIYYYCCES